MKFNSNLKNKKIIDSFKFTAFVVILLLCVFAINKIEFPRSGLGMSVGFLKMEVPIIIYFSLSLYVILKRKWWSFFVTAIPVCGFYLFIQEHYIVFNRFPKISDVHQLDELFSILSGFHLLLVIVGLFLYLSLIYLSINIKKLKNIWVLTSFILGLTLVLKFFPSTYINLFDKLNFSYVHWDLKRSARKSGYLNFILYEEAVKNKVFIQLNNLPVVRNSGLISRENDKQNLRDVHVLVLESFYNPNDFSNLTFSKNPFHQDFIEIIEGKEMMSISPVYGGRTAQAEFEILTGIPAYESYGSVEFNLFTGNDVSYGLPYQLQSLGYKTLATNGLKPYVFNSFNAYKGLGFSEQNYITGTTYLEKNLNDTFIFDGDLLTQNYDYLTKKMGAAKSPIFNYIMTIYGHYPFQLNQESQPQIIDVFLDGDKSVDDAMVRSINQIYYRTKALADYIEKIHFHDPTSILIIVSDHLPSFSNFSDLGYIYERHKTPLYIFNGENAISFKDNIHHYEIKDILIDILRVVEKTDLPSRKEIYSNLLREAVD